MFNALANCGITSPPIIEVTAANAPGNPPIALTAEPMGPGNPSKIVPKPPKLLPMIGSLSKNADS